VVKVVIDINSYIKKSSKAPAIQSSPLIMPSIQMMTDLAVNSSRFTTYSPNFSSAIKAFRNASYLSLDLKRNLPICFFLISDKRSFQAKCFIFTVLTNRV